MNEAFNLYTVVTYAAHAHGSEQTEGGSLWRYYVIGWGARALGVSGGASAGVITLIYISVSLAAIPALCVAVSFASTRETYLGSNMCWVSTAHTWLYMGPALGIISVRRTALS